MPVNSFQTSLNNLSSLCDRVARNDKHLKTDAAKKRRSFISKIHANDED